MIKDVKYPRHLFMGIRPLKGGHSRLENIRVFGLDTETFHGIPISLQVDGPDDSLFIYTTPDSILRDLWTFFRERMRPKGVNVAYVHNLNFDLRTIFSKFHLIMYEQFGDIKFQTQIGADLVDISIIFGKVNKADLKCGPFKLQILDSKAFTQVYFEKSLKMFGIPADKLGTPEGLGKIDYSTLNYRDPLRLDFEKYAIQDAHAERLLGERIMEFHKEYDIRPSISLPSFAARVFRRHCMMLNDEIPFPGIEVVKAAELSYHGGKNGYYSLGAKVFEDVYEYDINSAYPYAMHSLPPLTKGQYFKVGEFNPAYVGIYCISGSVLKKSMYHMYPLVFDHQFKAVHGDFKELWHTSYEVAEMYKRFAEVKIDSIWGYVWIPEGGINPFGKFVDRFYGLKQSTPKTDPHYHFYKIVLNALYGKLVSTIEVASMEQSDEAAGLRRAGYAIPANLRLDSRFDPVLGKVVRINRHWRAGAMYNPFLASLITGHTRTYLYQLETKTWAIHSATDAVKTRVKLEAFGGDLGGYKLECFGRCYIFRNKLYLHFCKDPSICGHKEPPYKYPKRYVDGRPHPRAGEPMVDLDGQHLCKVAMHGYKGPLWQLFENRMRLIQTGFMEYQYIHVVGLREGMRRKLQPCDFITLNEVLDLRTFKENDLLSFVIGSGGINLDAGGYHGELEQFSFKECRVRGIVRRLGGMGLSYMAEKAWDHGFLQNNDHDELLDKLDRAIRGEKIYSREDHSYDDFAPAPDAEEIPNEYA